MSRTRRATVAALLAAVAAGAGAVATGAALLTTSSGGTAGEATTGAVPVPSSTEGARVLGAPLRLSHATEDSVFFTELRADGTTGPLTSWREGETGWAPSTGVARMAGDLVVLDDLPEDPVLAARDGDVEYRDVTGALLGHGAYPPLHSRLVGVNPRGAVYAVTAPGCADGVGPEDDCFVRELRQQDVDGTTVSVGLPRGTRMHVDDSYELITSPWGVAVALPEGAGARRRTVIHHAAWDDGVWSRVGTCACDPEQGMELRSLSRDELLWEDWASGFEWHEQKQRFRFEVDKTRDLDRVVVDRLDGGRDVDVVTPEPFGAHDDRHVETFRLDGGILVVDCGPVTPDAHWWADGSSRWVVVDWEIPFDCELGIRQVGDALVVSTRFGLPVDQAGVYKIARDGTAERLVPAPPQEAPAGRRPERPLPSIPARYVH